MVFDLLARSGKDLRDRPYLERRAEAGEAPGRGLPHGLVLTPATTDPAVARSWMLGHGGSGIEGVVAKRLDQPYRPGVRGWQKLRTRITAEAVVGGIIGPVDAPRELILGRHDDTAGSASPAAPPASAPPPAPRSQRCSDGAGPRLARTAARAPLGRAPRPPTPASAPTSSSRSSADLALDGLRWRHPVRFVRLRPDLHPADLVPAQPSTTVEKDEADRRSAG